MKHESRLHRHEQEDEQEHGRLVHPTEAHTAAAPLEFASPEQALRQDRDATPVPATVALRLAASLRAEPTATPPSPSPSTWWKRLLGRAPETPSTEGPAQDPP